MTSASSAVVLLVILLAFFHLGWAYYLPGVSAMNYEEGDLVPLTVNALKSPRSVVPYDYYHKRLHFCRPSDDEPPKRAGSNLGASLFGDRVFESPFQLKMMKNESCVTLCRRDLEKEQVNFLIERIQQEYMVNWFVDSLPAAHWASEHTDYSDKFLLAGFNLGTWQKDVAVKQAKPYLNNHYAIEISVFEEGKVFRVVQVVVRAASMPWVPKVGTDQKEADCVVKGGEEQLVLEHDKQRSVYYTYSVEWVKSTIPWGTRWDNYLHVYDPKIHWFSLVNFLVIIVFLTFMVAMILLRALHKDISRYNQDSPEDAQEEYGWKLLHGDVFRIPRAPLILSVFVGNGVQIFLMLAVTLALALVGILSPSLRGSMVSVAVAFYVCFSLAAGYTAARLYKMLAGESWKLCVILTATLIPGVLSLVLFVLNTILWAKHSSAAVPFGTLAGLLALWILISCPLCFIGSYLGFRAEKINLPTQVHQIPRQVPPQPFHLQRIPSILLGGILPFGAIFIELYFIMNSIWLNRIYYVFGFLFMVFLILTVTCAEVSILMCYFHLCAEDYRWWWRSFLTAGSSALFLLINCLVYMVRLDLADVSSLVLFVGWTSALSMAFFILTGSIGFLATLWFVRKIYSAIRID